MRVTVNNYIVAFLIVLSVLTGCSTKEKTAPLPPYNIEQRSAALSELKSSLEKLESADSMVCADMLSHNDYRVRRAAARKLSTLKEHSDIVIEKWIGASADQNTDVRIAVIAGLSTIDDDRVVEPLIRALADSDSKVRLWAHKGIKKREKRAVPIMIRIAADGAALSNLTFVNSMNKTESLLEVLFSTLQEMGRTSVPHLVEIIKEDNDEWTRRALGILGRIGKDAGDAVPNIVDLLETQTNDSVLVSAINALADIGDMDPRVMPLLMELFGK